MTGFDLGAVGHINVGAPHAETEDVPQFGVGASALAVRSLQPFLDGKGAGPRGLCFSHAPLLLGLVLGAGAEFDPASAVVAVLHGDSVVEAHALGIGAFPVVPREIAIVAVAHGL